MKSTFNNEQILRDIVLDSTSKRQVLLKMKMKAAGGNYNTLDKYLTIYQIKTDHFLGQSSNKGKVFPNTRKDALLHCYEGSNVTSHKLKLLLIRDGYKIKKCEKCNLEEWMGEDLPLELDHIDGNRLNNKLDNLQILCPNCHSVKTRKQIKK